MRDRAMAGSTICANSEANRAFLGCLNGIVTPAIDLETTTSTFIQRILCLNQFWTICNNPTCSLVSSDLFISGCHKDDVTFKAYTAAFEKQHDHRFHGDHLFHIERTTSVNKVIGYISRKWVMRPLLRFHRNNIGMRHKQKWRL